MTYNCISATESISSLQQQLQRKSHQLLTRLLSRSLGFQAFLQLVELVLQLPDLLVRQHLLLLVVLDSLLDILDGLLLVLVAQCHHLVDNDLVSSAIVDILCGLVATKLICLICHRLTLDAKEASLHDPLLGRHAVAELLVVGDDEDSALVVLDGQDQRTKALAVKVVRGLVKNEHVRVLPHGCSKHNLDLHAAAQLVNLSVAGGLRVYAEIGQVLLD
mmetsp:Transcript_67924/g.109449  ORF Transcript_67924/g.109449 Transcript_67924/m.109449 type:complete len:218 (-) Transcript_67924:457-1110(-)